MEKLKIVGGHQLSGEITIGGAKNSAVALVPAAILSDKVIIDNVPEISDMYFLEEIITYLGAEFFKEGKQLIIDSKKVKNKEISSFYSKSLRASYYFMGALLGKFKHAEMYFPGGCKIGSRPINLHLEGFEKLGAKVTRDGDKYILDADKLIGTDIEFAFPSVGATINILMAATLAEGTTIIKNAAKEPEIGNLIDFLISMGAKIEGKDTSTLKIEGVEKLSGGHVSVLPDRIEAGTYIIAGAMIGDNLKIKGVNPEHLKALINELEKIGVNLEVNEDNIIVYKSDNLKATNITTEVYPGFPTDLQQPITPLLTKCNGLSTVTETIYENRFQNVKYFNDMEAGIIIEGNMLKIKGPVKLKGTITNATDLRAGASLILAALIADGVTIIESVSYVLRGYEKIISKLHAVGAEIGIE